MNNDTQRMESALEPTSGGGFSRRQLMKAGAWAAPVVVLAAAVPAAAASAQTLKIVSITAPTPTTTGFGTLYTQPVTVRVKNNSSSSVSVQVALAVTNGDVQNSPSAPKSLGAFAEDDFTGFVRRRFVAGGSDTATMTASTTSAYPTASNGGTITRGQAINLVF